MASVGVERSARKLGGPGRGIFLIALDHGLPAGPIQGIERPSELLNRVRGVDFTGVILNPGMVRHAAPHIPEDRALIVHLSGGTLLGARPTSKILTGTVESAAGLGADAVSVQVAFRDPAENRMIADAGRVIGAAHRLGIPVLVMAHLSRSPGTPSEDIEGTAHAARAAAELGADLVQVSFSGGYPGLRRIVEGCPAPVLLAGGPAGGPEERWLEIVREAVPCGMAGVSVGRMIFQSPDPTRLAARIAGVLRRDPVPVVRIRGMVP